MLTNLQVGWAAILVGIAAGMMTGMFFHKDDFLGGYTSWSRRLTRLGHIALVGLGLINICFALSAQALDINDDLHLSSILLIIGVITMPTVCFLSAFRKWFRNLFAIPVLSVLGGVAVFLWRILFR